MNHPSPRPVIGITMDREPGGSAQEGQYSRFPWLALRENYASSIYAAGGEPLPLWPAPERIDAYLDRIDGLLITGGAFDIPPSLYGEADAHSTVTLKEERTQFEWRITQEALARGLPLLGICGGMQLLNVVLGGSLIQHIPDACATPINHEQPNPRDQAGHEVSVIDDTLLARCVETYSAAFPPDGRSLALATPAARNPDAYWDRTRLLAHDPKAATLCPDWNDALRFPVNSAHHQAVRTPGPGVTVNAWSPDGIIEGIEYPAHPFCLGVEWHPEFLISPLDDAVLKAFVRAAAGNL